MKKSPIWLPISRLAQLGLAANTRAWLLAPGSTTRLFNSLSQSPMQVRCLQQRWKVPLRAETDCLSLPSYRQILLREVELLCDGDIWMYARTAIPSETLTGKYQQLRRLGTRPLGNILFRDPLTKRSPFEVALLKPTHLEYQLAVRHLPTPLAADEPLLARRSIFSLPDFLMAKPLLLTEVFLPLCAQRLTEHVETTL